MLTELTHARLRPPLLCPCGFIPVVVPVLSLDQRRDALSSLSSGLSFSHPLPLSDAHIQPYLLFHSLAFSSSSPFQEEMPHNAILRFLNAPLLRAQETLLMNVHTPCMRGCSPEVCSLSRHHTPVLPPTGFNAPALGSGPFLMVAQGAWHGLSLGRVSGAAKATHYAVHVP